MYWGFVIIVLLMGIFPVFLRGQKWAIISLFGFMLAALVAMTLAGDGSIAVAYDGSGNPITNPDSLPVTVMAFLTLMDLIITIAKGVDVI